MMLSSARAVFLGVLMVLFAALEATQDQKRVIVVDGATLIDGAGGNPLANSRIVIRGERIQAVGPAGSVAIPEKATIIDARRKFVIPGLTDAHVHYRTWQGELFLATRAG